MLVGIGSEVRSGLESTSDMKQVEPLNFMIMLLVATSSVALKLANITQFCEKAVVELRRSVPRNRHRRCLNQAWNHPPKQDV